MTLLKKRKVRYYWQVTSFSRTT